MQRQFTVLQSGSASALETAEPGARRTIIGGNPLGLEVEACLDAVEYGLEYIDLDRNTGRYRLDVDDHPVQEIDQMARLPLAPVSD